MSERVISERQDDPLWNRGLLLIKLRWLAFATALVLLGFAALLGDFFGVGTGPLTIVAVVLGVSNLVFHLSHVRLHKGEMSSRKRKLYNAVFITEIVADYASVSILILNFGFMSLNLGVLFLPHVILAAIICEKRGTSLGVTVLALVLIYSLAVFHWDSSDQGMTFEAAGKANLSSPLAFAVYNTGIILFVFFLSSILVREIVRRKNELAEINRKLVEMDREKQNYTLRATHELKAPFAAIQSYTDVILDGYLGEITPKMRGVMEKIRARCEALSKMIKNIIQLSNLRTTLFRTEDYKVVNARELALGRITDFTDRAMAEGKTLRAVQNASDEMTVAIIPNLFEILLNNLVINALNYSEAGGEIVITVSSKESGSKVEFAVRDQGIGIPKEALGRVFEEHYRSENAVDINPGGNGMGLAIVKEAVRLHDGEISVDSEEGSWTEFRILIPASRS